MSQTLTSILSILRVVSRNVTEMLQKCCYRNVTESSLEMLETPEFTEQLLLPAWLTKQYTNTEYNKLCGTLLEEEEDIQVKGKRLLRKLMKGGIFPIQVLSKLNNESKENVPLNDVINKSKNNKSIISVTDMDPYLKIFNTRTQWYYIPSFYQEINQNSTVLQFTELETELDTDTDIETEKISVTLNYSTEAKPSMVGFMGFLIGLLYQFSRPNTVKTSSTLSVATSGEIETRVEILPHEECNITIRFPKNKYGGMLQAKVISDLINEKYGRLLKRKKITRSDKKEDYNMEAFNADVSQDFLETRKSMLRHSTLVSEWPELDTLESPESSDSESESESESPECSKLLLWLNRYNKFFTETEGDVELQSFFKEEVQTDAKQQLLDLLNKGLIPKLFLLKLLDKTEQNDASSNASFCQLIYDLKQQGLIFSASNQDKDGKIFGKRERLVFWYYIPLFDQQTHSDTLNNLGTEKTIINLNYSIIKVGLTMSVLVGILYEFCHDDEIYENEIYENVTRSATVAVVNTGIIEIRVEILPLLPHKECNIKIIFPEIEKMDLTRGILKAAAIANFIKHHYPYKSFLKMNEVTKGRNDLSPITSYNSYFSYNLKIASVFANQKWDNYWHQQNSNSDKLT